MLEQGNGMHVNEDHFIVEVIDPDTGAVLPDGEQGELVFTCITKEAFPILRYRTRDIGVIHRGKCACGRTFAKMTKPRGRTDDMLIIRGVNVFPSQIETVLIEQGYAPVYQIVVDRANNFDSIEVRVEISSEIFSDTVRDLAQRAKELSAALKNCSAFTPRSALMGRFRQAIARKCGHFMGRTIDPETEIVATIGSTEAMVDTLFALTNPGDRVVMFSPFFENYRAQVIMADCEPVFVPLNPPTFSFDPNVLEDAFRGGAKAIIICNPSNPSGKVFTEEELKTIAGLCIRYDVYAIMDEVYEHIIYDGRKHVYMNSIPGMWERTVSCSSLSKTYSVTGWRLGYAIAPENIMARIRQYHDFNAVGCPSPLMEAAVVGLNMPLSYYDEFGAHYAHMKKIFTEGMRDIGIPFTDPEGTYFVLADVRRNRTAPSRGKRCPIPCRPFETMRRPSRSFFTVSRLGLGGQCRKYSGLPEYKFRMAGMSASLSALAA